MGIIKKIREKFDTFVDSIGRSRSGGINSIGFQINSFTKEEAKNWRETGIGSRIVELKVSNVFKEGFSSQEGTLGDETLAIIEKKLRRELIKAVGSMIAFGRGCILIIDGEDLDKPLKERPNLDTIRFRAFTGYDISVVGMVDTHIASKNFNKPLAYSINGIQIHHSRMMDFQYKQPTEQDKAMYEYGGISEFQFISQELENDKIISNSLPIIIQKMSTLIYKIKGYKEAVNNKNESYLLDVVKAAEDKRNISGALIIDSEDDTKVENQTVAGLDSVATFILRKIALVTGIPLAWLVGESVKGLGSTGDTEESIFWAMVKNLGNDYVLPVLNDALEKIGLADVWLNEQYQMTPKERNEQVAGVLANALTMRDLGIDYMKYIVENGLEIEEDTDFNENDLFEEEESENANYNNNNDTKLDD